MAQNEQTTEEHSTLEQRGQRELTGLGHAGAGDAGVVGQVVPPLVDEPRVWRSGAGTSPTRAAAV